MKRIGCLAFLLVLTSLVYTSSSATTVRSFSTEELTLGAHAIVEGHCLAIRPTWIDGNLVTTATVQVNASLKGNPTSQVSVILPGGIDLNRQVPIQVNVPGVPRLAPQEEVLLFLVPFTGIPNSYTVLGMAQGKFTLALSAAGAKQASNDLRGLRLASPATGAVAESSTSLNFDLQRFRDQIAEILAQAPQAETR